MENIQTKPSSKKVFITGATGNVGMEILKQLKIQDSELLFFAGVRHLDSDSIKLQGYPVVPLNFDFLDISTHKPALMGMHILFLLRPPQISQVGPYFLSIIKVAREVGIQFILFVSVQGVEKSSLIPHYKIEKEILQSGINYCFLRPAYFMQNFTTSLRRDLIQKNRLILPAGSAQFTLLDVEDLALVSLNVIHNPDFYLNSKMDLTSNDLLRFPEMATLLSTVLGRRIKFNSPSLLKFFIQKRLEGRPTAYILVLIMLHYLPRFQKAPKPSPWVRSILGREPQNFESFIDRNRKLLE